MEGEIVDDKIFSNLMICDTKYADITIKEYQ